MSYCSMCYRQFILILWCNVDAVLDVGIGREGQGFNISWLAGHHPVLDTAMLTSDANRSLGILLDLLRSASNLPGLLTISIVNR